MSVDLAERPRLSSDEMIDRVCRFTNITRSEFLARNSKHKPFGSVSKQRWAVMYELKRLRPDLSLRSIGAPVGIVDHTSVMHAMKRVEQLLHERDWEFLSLLEVLREPVVRK